jgi:hypothetical protein
MFEFECKWQLIPDAFSENVSANFLKLLGKLVKREGPTKSNAKIQMTPRVFE